MARRLVLIVRKSEYRAIQPAARSRHMSIAEWVRQTLDLIRRREPGSSVDRKLRVIRAASRFDFPIGGLEL